LSENERINNELLKELQAFSKRSLETLKEREEQLRLALHGADEHVWELNLQTGEIFSSQNLEITLGYEPVKSTEKLDWWRRNIPSDCAKEFELALNNYLEGKTERFEIEYRIKDSSGQRRWFWIRGKCVERDEDGRALRMLGTMSETTRRKSLDSEFRKTIQELESSIELTSKELKEIRFRLEESEADSSKGQAKLLEALKRLLDESRELVFVLDESGTLTFVNDYGAAFLSRPPSDIVGKKLQDIFPSQTTAFQVDKVMAVFESGEGAIVEDDVSLADRNICMETRLIPLIENGRTVSVLGMAHDISARKQMESALRESESRYRALFDSDIVGVAIVAPSGRIVRSNRVFREMLGYTGDELAVLGLKGITHPEEPDKNMEFLQETLEGKRTSYKLVKRYIRKDGSVMWGYLSVFAVFDENRNLSNCFATVIDITNNKQTEERLKQSENQYRAVVEDQTELVARFRIDGSITFVNDATCRFFGVRREELLKNNYDSYIAVDELGAVKARIEALSPVDPVVTVENHIVLPATGEKRWMQWTTRAIFDDEGNIAEVQAVGRDITLQKKLEEELWITRFSMDRASDAIYLAAPDARIVYVNDAACRKLGYSKEELLKMRLFDIDPSFSNKDWPSYWKNLKDLVSITLESTHRTKEGHEFSVEVISNSLIYEGKQYNCTFARDISWRKDMEMELIRSERRYRGIVEDQTELVCRFTPSGTLVFVNSAFSTYFETPREKLLEMRFMNFVHPDDKAPLTEKISALCLPSPTVTVEHRVILPASGEVRWLQWTNRAIYDDRNNFTEYQAVGRDITGKKQEDIALAESERKFRELAELLPEIIFETDVKGNFTYVNRNALKITGKVYVGLNCLDTIAPEDRQSAAEYFRQIMEGIRHEGSEYEMLRKDGKRFPVIIYASPIYRDGNPAGLRGIVTDITKFRLAQQGKEQMLEELKGAISNVKMLSGLLPICASCKKIRDEDGYWKKLEGYLSEHFDSSFSYHACPECASRLYVRVKAIGKSRPYWVSANERSSTM
jgi:PAS domain S-box-containing protein